MNCGPNWVCHKNEKILCKDAKAQRRKMNRYVVALTGASGMIQARELLAYFADRPDLELHALISRAGEQVLSLAA
jgi:hypothetical protein